MKSILLKVEESLNMKKHSCYLISILLMVSIGISIVTKLSIKDSSLLIHEVKYEGVNVEPIAEINKLEEKAELIVEVSRCTMHEIHTGYIESSCLIEKVIAGQFNDRSISVLEPLHYLKAQNIFISLNKGQTIGISESSYLFLDTIKNPMINNKEYYELTKKVFVPKISKNYNESDIIISRTSLNQQHSENLILVTDESIKKDLSRYMEDLLKSYKIN